MVDAVTNERLVVHGEAMTGSHIIVPVQQLARVTQALTHEGVRFWVSSESVQLDDQPAVIFVKLSRTSNTAAVQQLLDTL